MHTIAYDIYIATSVDDYTDDVQTLGVVRGLGLVTVRNTGLPLGGACWHGL
jgi:hypothetical protein